jgi:hypothetical protein
VFEVGRKNWVWILHSKMREKILQNANTSASHHQCCYGPISDPHGIDRPEGSDCNDKEKSNEVTQCCKSGLVSGRDAITFGSMETLDDTPEDI